MSDQDDDFEDDFDDAIGEDPSFDDFGQGGSLGELWRDNPMVKVGVIVGAGVLIFGTILLMGGEKEDPNVSFVPQGSEVAGTPGTEQTSPSYEKAIQEYNETQIERAIKEGESALPIPVKPPVGQIPVNTNQQDEEDPLLRWRRLQEERLQREAEQRDTSNTVAVDAAAAADTARDEAIQQLADAMSEQMQSVLENQGTETGVDVLQVTDPAIFDPPAPVDANGNPVPASAAGAAPGTNFTVLEDGTIVPVEEPAQTILMPAGEIVYAQLITEANSDAPGPVLAQIAGGPLSGARVLGSFEVQQELLTLSFNTLVYEGESLPIDAVGLDPGTTLPGMATEVDRRIFRRVILPMAANFVEGAAQAIADSGLTTVTIQGETVAEETGETDNEQEIASGIEEAGEELADILEEEGGNIEVLVRIESGTPMGILFLEPVLQDSNI